MQSLAFYRLLNTRPAREAIGRKKSIMSRFRLMESLVKEDGKKMQEYFNSSIKLRKSDLMELHEIICKRDQIPKLSTFINFINQAKNMDSLNLIMLYLGKCRSKGLPSTAISHITIRKSIMLASITPQVDWDSWIKFIGHWNSHLTAYTISIDDSTIKALLEDSEFSSSIERSFLTRALFQLIYIGDIVDFNGIERMIKDYVDRVSSISNPIMIENVNINELLSMNKN